MNTNTSPMDLLCINTIRTLSIDAIQKANSGHPGLPLGCAPFAYVLFQNHLKFNPKSPHFFDRDRFILSAGHGSMLVYSLLHLYGYDVTLNDIKNFRQFGSKTPGHPEAHVTPGIEATTGPLGQGTANAVGMAIAERRLASLLNTTEHSIVNHFTYALVSDGDLMEGISTEAASLAGHLKLGKLIYLYDSNDISLDGPTSLTFTENVAKRYESYGWHVITVANADHDLMAIDRAISAAKAESSKPSLVILKTTIGFGSPNKAGKSSSHGSPLGPDELLATKKALNWQSNDPFFVPNEAREHFHTAGAKGAIAEDAWDKTLAEWKKHNPTRIQLYQDVLETKMTFDFDSYVSEFKVGEDFATRESSGKILNQVANHAPTFFGGDADLSCSTNTLIKDGGSFNGQTGGGRNIHYGVREHAMAAIANGIAYHGGLRTFTATFFCFTDYMKPAIRLAAMNHLPVTFIFTHDSIGLGEDGPTHQPVEQLMSMRVIPGLVTIRPADANEVREAWRHIVNHNQHPVCLVLSRQKLITQDRTRLSLAKGLHQGAYVLSEAQDAKVTLVATGSEVGLALETQKMLSTQGILARVVSMPSFELFKKLSPAEQDKIIPVKLPCASIEAGVTLGWACITGRNGLNFGVDTFGASAPASRIYEHFGLTASAISDKIKQWLKS